MRREQVVGQDFPVGQREERQALAAKEAQLGAAALKFARIGGDDHVEPRVRARGLRKRQRRGAAIELAPLDMRRQRGSERVVSAVTGSPLPGRSSMPPRTRQLTGPGNDRNRACAARADGGRISRS